MAYIPQSNLVCSPNQASRRRTAQRIHSFAASLGLPSGPKHLSNWAIQAMQTKTISIGGFLSFPISLDFSGFNMTVTNLESGASLAVSGLGAGAGIGEGLLPISYSGYVPGLHLPEIHSSLFLGPAGHQSMGVRLFQGVAVALHISEGVDISLGDSILFFLTLFPPPPRNNAARGVQLLDALSPDFIACVKAWTFATSLSYQSNASIGANVIAYAVNAHP